MVRSLSHRKILFIVDFQNDFVDPRGALVVPNARDLVGFINEKIMDNYYDEVWACQDWHPSNHISFASNSSKEVFSTLETSYGKQTLWPEHAIADTWGACFYKKLDESKFKYIIRKGMDQDTDSYSAFTDARGDETGAGKLLNKTDYIDFVGVATDFCLGNTVKDSFQYCDNIRVLKKGIMGIDENACSTMLKELQNKGAILV